MPLVGGRYETLERIGGGGMADVFRAHDRSLDRDVAVKILRPAFAKDPEFVERFHREAEALGAIDHPNIVRVLDYGANPDEGPFIVMELVSGGTLRDLMRERGRVDQYAAAEIAAAIADGLEAAHLRGVLHRDLKPDNVLMDAEGHPKVADFGIARIAAATAITRKGELLGTPQYLAPEQMSGDVVDERADVYALGVILYEMLTGAQPTGGTTPSEIVSRRLRVDPRPPSRLVALAPALNALVLRALARDPARRVRRAADLRAALLAVRPPVPRAAPTARAVRPRWPSPAPVLAVLALIAGSINAASRRARAFTALRIAMPVIRLPASPRLPVITLPAVPRLPVMRLPAPPPLPVIRLPAAPRLPVVRFRVPALPPPPRLPALRVQLPSLAPLLASLGLLAASLRTRSRELQLGIAALVARPAPSLATSRVRIVRTGRRSLAPLMALLVLLAAFVVGSFALAGPRPTAVAPAAIASPTPAPTTAVLASTSTPAVTSSPTVAPEPTAEPTPEPTAEPTPEPTQPAPVAPTLAPVATVSGDPAGTIVAFYQFISGHDYTTASGFWSDRMRASYPPQTNIWGRFDATRSIVARSASLVNATPGSAAVAVDLIETRTDGSVRRWVGTWYLVRSGSGWLLDQPILRAG